MARRATITSLAAAVLALGALGCGESDRESRADDRPTLFLAGDGEMWVVNPIDETSQRIRLPELSPGDPPHKVVVRGDRLVFWGSNTAWAADADSPQRPLDAISKEAWIWIPSAHPSRIWIGSLDPVHGGPRSRALGAVREIDANGTTTFGDVKPPEGAWPALALDSGLVFTPPEGIELWDPRTQNVVRRLSNSAIGDLGPAHDDLVASCTANCRRLILTDFPTGIQDRIVAPDDQAFEVWNAAFSPSGDQLAVPVRELKSGWPAPRRLALIDLSAHLVSVVEGSEVDGGYTFVVWSKQGDEVFMTGGERFERREIVGYQIGASTARAIDVKVGDFYDAAAR